jgi:hypothetical protein
MYDVLPQGRDKVGRYWEIASLPSMVNRMEFEPSHTKRRTYIRIC